MKKFFVMIMILIISGSAVYGQSYQEKRFWIGPTVGYAFADLGFGATGEYGMTENIGLSFDLGYSGFKEDFGGLMGGNDTYWEFTLFSALVSASYHFMPDDKFDPFLKAGIGYMNWDVKFMQDGKEIDMFPGSSAAYESGVGFTGQIGARYHFSEKWSGRAALGYPYIFSLGVDFSFGEEYKKTNKKKRSTPKVAATDTYEDNDVNDTDDRSVESIPQKDKKDQYSIYIGPYMGAKATANTTYAHGRTWSGIDFNAPSIGASFLLPFSNTGSIGFLLDLGYEPYGYTTKPYNNDYVTDENTVTEKYNYFNISPSLYLGGFVIGLNIGMPMSAEAYDADNDDVSVLDERGYEIPWDAEPDMVEYLATLLEIKIGGSIPLVSNEHGKLSLNIMATYALSGLYENEEVYKYAYDVIDNTSQTEAKSDLNPKPASLSLGLSYLFKVGL
ncbi:MAG: outer membrane beta-barrel protein [Candidatus Kapabacteria bacterium]|nr:outer membrane beta-barrel protein [Candidatus Kapabacteria bacterium]